MVKVEIDNFEGSYNEIEAKDLSIVNVSFKITVIREAHHNKIVLNTAMVINPISSGIMLILIEAEAVAVDLQFRGCGHGRAYYQNNNGTYQYQYYTHDSQSEQ